MKTTLKKPAKKPRKVARTEQAEEKDIAENYDRFKEFGGKHYTGMKVGRSHKWYYDQGEWKETKITPDLWAISYAVTKRRAGKAPKGSGARIGTAYHWYILAHQNVTKLNEDDYSTAMTGLNTNWRTSVPMRVSGAPKGLPSASASSLFSRKCWASWKKSLSPWSLNIKTRATRAKPFPLWVPSRMGFTMSWK